MPDSSTLPRMNPSDLPDPVDVSDHTDGLANVMKVIEAGPYDASWESLQGYRAPLWYRDGMFGIFPHWGVFSVPAFEHEWHSRKRSVSTRRFSSTVKNG